MKKRLMASLTTLALIAIVGASSVTADPGHGETIPGNPACDGTKIDPVAAGTYALASGGDIHITLGAGNTFSFTVHGATVSSIMVKGGPNAILWTFNPPVTSATGLHAPENLKNPNGGWYGLSHLCINSAKKTTTPPDTK